MNSLRRLAPAGPLVSALALGLALGLGAAALSACGHGAVDARYPERKPGCAVKMLPGLPDRAVDELGTVDVTCTVSGPSCDRQLLDAVCARGGDVAWGLGDGALSASRRVAHAAHSRRAVSDPRERGCDVKVFDDAPPMRTENIGPVEAWCAEDDAKATCLRELEDEVCLVGGDTLWQVEGPIADGNKKRMSGRAAHSN